MMTSQGGKGQLYNNASQASSYASFRPSYPPELFDAILDFADLPDKDLAVDLGCGKEKVYINVSTFKVGLLRQ